MQLCKKQESSRFAKIVKKIESHSYRDALRADLQHATPTTHSVTNRKVMFRENGQGAKGFQKCTEMDEFAKENRVYRLSTEEFKRFQGRCYPTLTHTSLFLCACLMCCTRHWLKCLHERVSCHPHGHPRCSVVRSLTLCFSHCSFPCVSLILSSSSRTLS